LVPEHPAAGGALTVHRYEMLPAWGGEELSVAVTVTVYRAALVGVPETVPDEFIDRPAGNPEADHE
jgi:hypothetical protein